MDSDRKLVELLCKAAAGGPGSGQALAEYDREKAADKARKDARKK